MSMFSNVIGRKYIYMCPNVGSKSGQEKKTQGKYRYLRICAQCNYRVFVASHLWHYVLCHFVPRQVEGPWTKATVFSNRNSEPRYINATLVRQVYNLRSWSGVKLLRLQGEEAGWGALALSPNLTQPLSFDEKPFTTTLDKSWDLDEWSRRRMWFLIPFPSSFPA